MPAADSSSSRRAAPRLSLRRRLLYPVLGVIAATAVAVLGRLPYHLGQWFAARLGDALYLVPGQRRLTLANLAIAFPEKPDAERRRIARASLRKLVRSVHEVVWYLHHPQGIIQRVHAPPAVRAIFERLQAKGHGVVLLTPHLGYWEMANFGLNAHGVPVVAVMNQHGNPYIDRLLVRARAAFGAEIIHDTGAAKVLFRRLKDGKSIAMLVDQNTRPSKGGMFVNFFGLPTTMSRAPAVFARRTGSPIMVGACLPDPITGQLVLHGEVICQSTDEFATDEALGQAICDVTERLVRASPDQYLWLYKKWRYIPADYPASAPAFPYYASVYHERTRHAAASTPGVPSIEPDAVDDDSVDASAD